MLPYFIILIGFLAHKVFLDLIKCVQVSEKYGRTQLTTH